MFLHSITNHIKLCAVVPLKCTVPVPAVKPANASVIVNPISNNKRSLLYSVLSNLLPHEIVTLPFIFVSILLIYFLPVPEKRNSPIRFIQSTRI